MLAVCYPRRHVSASGRAAMRAFMLLIGFALLSALPASPLSAAALGDTCDGIAAIRCDEGLWCEHPAGQCKVADGAGVCANEPEAICDADLPSRSAAATARPTATIASAGQQGPARPCRRVRQVRIARSSRCLGLEPPTSSGQALVHEVAHHRLAAHHQAERLFHEVVMRGHAPGDGRLVALGLERELGGARCPRTASPCRLWP